MNLFLIVWMYDDSECEWTLIASTSDYLDTDEELKAINDFMLENHELESDDFELLDAWTNKVDKVDGYTVTLGAKE